jgi:hypothetical protein
MEEETASRWDANILNKKLWTSGIEWSSSLGLAGANNPLSQNKLACYEISYKSIGYEHVRSSKLRKK